MFHRRRERFKFTEKKHSKKGILACIFAVGLIALYVVMLIRAYEIAGNLSMYYGSAGVFAMVLAVMVLVLAIESMREENSFLLFPRIALGMSLLDVICWIGTYTIGFLL